MSDPTPQQQSEAVFRIAAELFAVMAAPMRLKILSALCREEQNVGRLLEVVGTSQPNLSQHLAALYRAGIVARRRAGNQIWYSVCNPKAASLCREVCTQLAIELGDPASVQPADRLAPALASRISGA